MMLSEITRRTREFRGPAPGNVAILAKNPKKTPMDNIILESRRKEDKLTEYTNEAKAQAYMDLKNTWERQTEKKLQGSSIKRQVADMMRAMSVSVEHRRDRLREMLRQEEEEFLKEMEGKQETILERQAKMRERAKALKEKRERERSEYVEVKLDQRWREECEELRSTMSKRLHDEVSAELVFQMQEKLEQQKLHEEKEQMYAELWEADMHAKADREEREARDRHERNRHTLAVLQTQIAALEERKEEEKRLIAEQAELLRLQAELRKLEEQREAEDKRRRQEEAKHLYETNLRIKMKRQAKEEQEQLAFDMKVLEQLLQETQNEAMHTAQRKKELREENLRYMDYLRQLAEEEKQRQKEMEAIIDSEVEKAWQRRLAQWRLEKEARQRMLREVLAERSRQIQEKLAQNERQREEALHERERIQQLIEENRRQEEQRAESVRRAALGHQQDLLDQMSHETRLRRQREDETTRELAVGQRAELEYQRKLKQCLDEPHGGSGDLKLHPMRRHQYRLQSS